MAHEISVKETAREKKQLTDLFSLPLGHEPSIFIRNFLTSQEKKKGKKPQTY